MGSSQGRWWGSNREGVRNYQRLDFFFASPEGTAVLPGGFCEGFEVKRGYIEGFGLNNWKKGISPSEVVRDCLGGQIKNVRHPRGRSFV